MDRQKIFHIGSDNHCKFRKLARKARAVASIQLLNAWVGYQEFLQQRVGTKNYYLVTTDEDCVPQSPYMERSRIDVLSNLDSMAADSEAETKVNAQKDNANYMVASTMRFAVIALVCLIVVLALFFAVKHVSIGDILNHWKHVPIPTATPTLPGVIK